MSMNHSEELSLSGTAVPESLRHRSALPESFMSMNHSEEASLSGTAVPERQTPKFCVSRSPRLDSRLLLVRP